MGSPVSHEIQATMFVVVRFRENPVVTYETHLSEGEGRRKRCRGDSKMCRRRTGNARRRQRGEMTARRAVGGEGGGGMRRAGGVQVRTQRRRFEHKGGDSNTPAVNQSSPMAIRTQLQQVGDEGEGAHRPCLKFPNETACRPQPRCEDPTTTRKAQQRCVRPNDNV